MAVGIRIKLPGVNQEQFDKVNEHVMGSGGLADGMIFHSSGPIDGGWGVIDFWESRGQFDALDLGLKDGSGPIRRRAIVEKSVRLRLVARPLWLITPFAAAPAASRTLP